MNVMETWSELIHINILFTVICHSVYLIETPKQVSGKPKGQNQSKNSTKNQILRKINQTYYIINHQHPSSSGQWTSEDLKARNNQNSDEFQSITCKFSSLLVFACSLTGRNCSFCSMCAYQLIYNMSPLT